LSVEGAGALLSTWDLRRASCMIFVTVGNANQSFQRLLDTLDRLAQQGFFEGEALLVQCGNNPEFHSSHSIQQDFFPLDQFAATIRGASLVISHVGAAALLHTLSAGKVSVVMPRRGQYNEHGDDHQGVWVRAVAAAGRW